jgi:hypothetical protein
MVAIALAVPDPKPFQYFIFRVAIALGAGGTAAGLPGFFEFKAKWKVVAFSATGAVGVFVLVYWWNPPGLTPS